MPLDHLAYAAPDLTEAVDDLERRFGVRAAPGGQHRGRGTHNTLLSFGEGRYLEIIAADPSQPEPGVPLPFGVDPSKPARLAGWAWRVDDIDAAVARARQAGFDPGDPVAMHRLTTDGVELHWRLTLNAAAGSPVPFLIDWGETPHPSRSSPAGLRLISLRIEHPDPDTIAAALSAMGAEADVAAAPEVAIVAILESPLGRQELR